MPFKIRVGLPFVALIVLSADSDASASSKASFYNPTENLGALHTIFRIFVNLEETTGNSESTCSEFCAFHTIDGTGKQIGADP